MRHYGQIQCAFWSDPEIQALSDQGKLLAAYLLTGQHSNGLGCYRLPNGYVMADFGWSSETVSNAFAELFRIGFCKRCDSTFFVLIPKFLYWNEISNSNVAKAREKEFDSIPKKSSIYSDLINVLKRYGKHFSETFQNRLETLSKGYGKQEPTLPEPNPDPEPNLNQPGEEVAGRPAPQGNGKARTADLWEAYSEAYQRRYGVKPVRNAKVNGQLSGVIDRLGNTEAPFVAAYFLTSNNSWYVRQGHSVDCLLKDAEKLRTEWATRRQMTDRQARELDRKSQDRNEWLQLMEEAEHAGQPAH